MTRQSLLASTLLLPLRAVASANASPSFQPLRSATGWLGNRPSLDSLRGRVVLLDVFTFECINCVRITSNLKRIYAEYSRSDLEIVAVHTPEVVSYQKSIAYLAQQTRRAALPWPIAIDNNHAIWDAYGVSAWPTQLIFNRSGRLETTIVGDSQDREVRAAVQSLVHRR